jgi:hypothetical protein
LNFEKSSSTLEDILNQQISPNDNTCIGYDHKQNHIEEEKSFKLPRKTEEIPESHTNGSRDSNIRVNNMINQDMKRNYLKDLHFKQDPFLPGIKFISWVFFFLATILDIIDCRAYARNNQVRNRGICNNVGCYKWYDYGHIAWDYINMMEYFMKENAYIKYKKVWRRKQKQEDQGNEEFSKEIPT